MTRKGDKEGNIAPFLAKCYDMVDDETTDAIISWNQSNHSFIIWNITDFTRDLLPIYFKHNHFSSFMRQLNIYGFRKADTDRWEFTNDKFIKGEKHLLKTIKRRKNIQSSMQKISLPEQLTEVSDKEDFVNLETVETLKTDKVALMQEVTNLRERQESSKNKLHLLSERLEGMENNQEQLLSFIVMVMQSPGLLVQLLKPKEASWRVAQPSKFTLDEETGFESTVVLDESIVRYQPMSTDEPSSTLPSLTEDFSFNGIENFFMNFNIPSPTFDESFPWSDNYGSIQPELDLEKLEKFLLSSPSQDFAEEPLVDDDQTLVSEMEMETILCEEINHPVSVEILTEKMGCLSPGRKIRGTKERR